VLTTIRAWDDARSGDGGWHDGEMPSLLEYARRGTWLVLGLLCVAIGAIGIVVPGLPTTVFFIAAAACFARSNPRLEQWVIGLPRIGPAVQRYRAGQGMPKRAKYWAIGMMLVFSTVGIVLVGSLVFGVVVGAVVAVGVWFVAIHVPTTPGEALDHVTAR
jgi:uncharacterized membrane protein YbaN (DUF454 family)